MIAIPDGSQGSLPIHQDISLLAVQLAEGEAVTHALAAGRHDLDLEQGDGVAAS